MIKRIVSPLAVAVLSVGGLAVAQPAQAAPGLECVSSEAAFCLFSHPSRPEQVVSLPANFPRNMCVNVVKSGDPVDNFDNNTAYVWFGYRTFDCRPGTHIEFEARTDGGMLGTFGRAWSGGRLHGVTRTALRRTLR